MKNRDSNENIYRNMEKPYALLQVHILFSFHTLNIYYFVKPMQIYGIFTEYPWKIMENMRKIIPFLSISFHNLFRMTRFSRSFLRSFLEKIGEFRRKSENIGEKWRISETSFRFHSFSFHFIPLHSTSFHFHSIFFLFIPQPLDFLPQMLNLTIHNKKVIFLFGRT